MRTTSVGGTRWRIWLRHYATSRKVAGSNPDGVIGNLIDIILPAALWPWGWISLWQKWVPRIVPAGKGGGWERVPVLRADKLTTFMCRISWTSLKILNTPGPVQVCNGIAFSLQMLCYLQFFCWFLFFATTTRFSPNFTRSPNRSPFLHAVEYCMFLLNITQVVCWSATGMFLSHLRTSPNSILWAEVSAVLPTLSFPTV